MVSANELQSLHVTRSNSRCCSTAQTDVKDPSAEPSTDDFLAREKAALGDDAELFATNDDASAVAQPGGDGDLLGESEPVAESAFESQFPDLAAQPAVCQNHLHFFPPNYC